MKCCVTVGRPTVTDALVVVFRQRDRHTSPEFYASGTVSLVSNRKLGI